MSENSDSPKLLERLLSDWMAACFRNALKETDADLSTIAVVTTSNPDFGDYQCNNAMALAGTLKQPPRAIAEAVTREIVPHEAVERVEVAGAGFINIFLKTEWVASFLERLAGDDRLGVPAPGAGRTVVMDYGSPNMTKPLHIGHLRSHNIGNVLDRMHRFLGYRVIADNHLGDWGTQFGITIMGYRRFGDEKAMEEHALEELERVYVKSYERSKEDEGWLDQCRRELVKLQSGDPENRKLWKIFMDLSLHEIERIYKRLGISYDLVRGESYYHDKLARQVAVLETKGLARESEGATVVFLEEEKLPPCIVRKKDGGYLYATSDVATIESRVAEFEPEKIVYVTDERQQLHFRQVFAISRRLGHTTRLDHVWFGLMRLKDAVFATREGNVIRLESLLDEAEARALDVVKNSGADMTEEEQKEVARAVGIGAVKYADLSQNPQSVVVFEWDKALALDGSSGPYLQYAYARIASVRGKFAERFPDTDPATFPVLLSEPVERTLAVKLIRFPEVVLRASLSYRPNVLCEYLNDLTQTYSTFYQTVPFLKAPEGVRESRVRLCGIVARVLGKGLDLLGIETPERI